MAPEITYCSTPPSIALAVSVLSSQSVLLVDCEAQDLGMPGGVLSLIALSDPLANHVFLIDALAFPSCPPSPGSYTSPQPSNLHPELAPILDLLCQPSLLKVFWDGRADALELFLTYGVVLANVLDLQLVDVVMRAKGISAQDLRRGYFKPIAGEIKRNPGAYAGIYQLRGLGHVVAFFRLLPKGNKNALKDPAVVAMHESGESALWLARPLPAPLIAYAANDLTLIALVYAHFTGKAWVCQRMPVLCAQSAVYVGMLRSREEDERLTTLGLKRFMPLGIVDDEEIGRSEQKYLCRCCERGLGADCFVKRVQIIERGGGENGGREAGKTMTIERLSFCRLCDAVALRNERTQGEWVDFGSWSR